MGKTFAEKIFSLKTGKDLRAGAIVMVKPDFVLTHDNSSAILSTFKKMGGKKVADPKQLLIVLDHIVPANDEKAATNHQKTRQFVAEQKLPHFYEGGRGICHQVAVEEGFARPGAFIADRLVFTNMSVELGAKNGWMAPDKKAFDYLAAHGVKKEDCTVILPDADAVYAETLEIDVAKIEPLVAAPHSVDLVKTVAESTAVKADQVLIGTCTNGRIEDIRQAAEILKGRKVAKGTRLLVLPASSEVYIQAADEGLLKIFVQAGGIVLNPGCGPCLGAHQGIMAPGEITVSTANRNFKGRMGCNTSFIYLASPYTAAATAVKGTIATPDML
jgi:homoaconitase/3-isopropylmalate dehydratase large subunit